MYLKNIARPYMTIDQFLSSLDRDFSLCSDDADLIAHFEQKYNDKKQTKGNYFISAAVFINYIANKIRRLGLPEQISEDFRSNVALFREYYSLAKEVEPARTPEVVNVIIPKIRKNFEKLLARYEPEKNRIHEIRNLVQSSVLEYDILPAMSQSNTAHHCIKSSVRDVYTEFKAVFDNLTY